MRKDIQVVDFNELEINLFDFTFLVTNARVV